MSIKTKIYEMLDGDLSNNSILGNVIEISLMILILLNVLAVILGTVSQLYARFSVFFDLFEYFSVMVFTIEYVLRLWSCTTVQKYKNPITGRTKFILTPFAIIDLFAILPFYLPMIIPFDLRFIRIFRLIRIVRLLKIARYSEALRHFGRVFNEKKEELFVAFLIVIVLLVFSSSVMYYVENPAQPQVFSSIPAAMWWAVITLTTVGYGDIYPVTVLGKVIAAFIAFLGIAMFALPAGILASGFAEKIHKSPVSNKCPHCNKELSIP